MENDFISAVNTQDILTTRKSNFNNWENCFFCVCVMQSIELKALFEQQTLHTSF